VILDLAIRNFVDTSLITLVVIFCSVFMSQELCPVVLSRIYVTRVGYVISLILFDTCGTVISSAVVFDKSHAI